jgi:hypothetical protein
MPPPPDADLGGSPFYPLLLNSLWICGFFFAAEIDVATIMERMEIKRAVWSSNIQEAIQKLDNLNTMVGFCLCS